MGVDVIGVGEDRFRVRTVPLHGDIDFAIGGFTVKRHDLAVDCFLRLVDVLDEVNEAAVELERVLLALAALVGDIDLQPLGEEGRLTKARDQGVVGVIEFLEDLGVRAERRSSCRSRLACRPS